MVSLFGHLIDDDQLLNAPVFVRIVRQVPSNDDGYLSFFQLFHCDLQWIGFACCGCGFGWKEKQIED